MDNTAVFLQARMASSRLPGKALLPLAGKPVIQHAMEALVTLPAGRYVLLTDRESAPHFAEIAAGCGYDLFVGDPEDVLDRFCAAAALYSVDTIVRATGDNPLVSAAIAREALQLAASTSADYAGITDTPYGNWRGSYSQGRPRSTPRDDHDPVPPGTRESRTLRESRHLCDCHATGPPLRSDCRRCG
jgi:spore coat polysaccharide biosynthesis protein SpsF (cytidylyltransferase family)